LFESIFDALFVIEIKNIREGIIISLSMCDIFTNLQIF